jgi:hypothetical protein
MKRNNAFVTTKVEVSDTHKMIQGTRPKTQPKPEKPEWPKRFGYFYINKKPDDFVIGFDGIIRVDTGFAILMTIITIAFIAGVGIGYSR